MLLAHIGFWILLIWAKKEEEIGWLEGGIYLAIWLVSVGFVMIRVFNPMVLIVTTVLMDIILLFRCGIANAAVR